MSFRGFPTPKKALLSSVALLLLCAQSLVAADATTLDQRLPEKTFAYISVPNVDVLKEKYKETKFYALTQEDKIQQFCTQLTDLINAAIEPKINMTVDDLNSILSGEVAFSVFKPSEKPLAVLLAANFGDSREKVDALVEKATASAEAEGAEIVEEEYEGATLNIVTVPVSDATVPIEQDVVFCIKENTFMISNSTNGIKDILDSWEGREEGSFRASPVYSEVLAQCVSDSGTSMFNLFVDPISLLKAAATSAGNQGMQLQFGLAMLEPLGLGNLKGIGSCSEMMVGDFETISRTLFYLDSAPSGLLNVLKFPATAQKPADWVPADAGSFQAFNWDAQSAYSAIVQLVDSFQPPGTAEAMIEGIAQQPDGPGVHIKKDIIDQLSGDIQFFTMGGEGDGIESLQSLVVFGAEVNDEEVMKDVLVRVSESPGFPADAREFQGTTIYEMANQNPAAPTIAFGVAKGYFFFATEVQMLEQVIRGIAAADSLAESEAYKKLAAHFPAETSIIGYTDPRSQIKPIYENLQSGDLGALIPQLDFSVLPPFEEIEQYFGNSASYTVPVANGAMMVQYQLKD